jgi:transposase
MWAARRGTIACSSKPFCSGFAPASPGAIFLIALAIGRPSINASTDGPRARWAKSGVFARVFKLLASDHDNEYMMIDATIVRAHQHSAGPQKKTARKPSVDPAAD